MNKSRLKSEVIKLLKDRFEYSLDGSKSLEVRFTVYLDGFADELIDFLEAEFEDYFK